MTWDGGTLPVEGLGGIKVGVVGAGGRMGRMIVRELWDTPGVMLAAACDSAGSEGVGQDANVLAGIGHEAEVVVGSDLDAMVRRSDCVIDFSTPGVSAQVASLCADHRASLVIGTTGLSKREQSEVEEAARYTPIVWAPNMSVGVNVLIGLVERAARTLGAEYDVEVVEAHHRHKKDAPSGTALRLGRAVAEATAEFGSFEARACYGRQGEAPRQKYQIGMHAVRGGDVVGDHDVMFCAEGERVVLTHRASSRRTFSKGAVRAARWVYRRPAGLYDMQDVLGLRRAD